MTSSVGTQTASPERRDFFERPECWSLASRSWHAKALRQRIYAAIVNTFLQEGHMPTVREIAQAVGVSSTSHIVYHLLQLRRAGCIRHLPETCRGMHFAAYAGSTPLLGVVAEGRLSSICSIVEAGLLKPAEASYALRIADQSLAGEHLCAGDVLFVRPRATSPEETLMGKLVVATHGKGEQRYATLTRFAVDPVPGPIKGIVGIVTDVVRLL